MPTEFDFMPGALFMADGTKLCDLSEIPDITTTLCDDDFDENVQPYIIVPPEASIQATIFMTRQQARRLTKTINHEINCYNRAVRRMKRDRERRRRKALKERMSARV